MTSIFDINELPGCFDWKEKSFVLIGKGNGADFYKFNPKKCIIFGVNDSCLMYKYVMGTIIIEAHFTKNFPIVNGKVDAIFYMTKQQMKNYQLTVGSTPTLFLSFIIKNIVGWKNNIYLQGFSMDGVSPANDPFPYNWERQAAGFVNLFELANKFNTKMRFVTPNKKMPQYPHGAPDPDDISK